MSTPFALEIEEALHHAGFEFSSTTIQSIVLENADEFFLDEFQDATPGIRYLARRFRPSRTVGRRQPLEVIRRRQCRAAQGQRPADYYEQLAENALAVAGYRGDLPRRVSRDVIKLAEALYNEFIEEFPEDTPSRWRSHAERYAPKSLLV